MTSTVCPGCGNAKTRRAKLCRVCRSSANEVGASVVTHVHDATSPASARPRTPEQNRVYHGKLADLALLEHVTMAVLKRRVLAEASSMFGREITSSTELTELEMERLLERLDDQLDAARS